MNIRFRIINQSALRERYQADGIIPPVPPVCPSRIPPVRSLTLATRPFLKGIGRKPKNQLKNQPQDQE